MRAARHGKATHWIFGALIVAALFIPGESRAARFANQFIEFELPPLWACSLEGAEWVCQSTDPAKKRDALIVLAAKLKGDQDSLDQYMTYLSTAKSYTSVQGKPVKSEVKNRPRTLSIGGQPWVDALHLESELPGFYTRYLATVKADIGVLVTYSINKNKYQNYLNDFEAMVKTLKVFRRTGSLNLGPAGGNLFNQAAIPTGMSENTVFPGNIAGGADDRPKPKQDSGLVYMIGAGAAALAFIMWRRKRSRDDY